MASDPRPDATIMATGHRNIGHPAAITAHCAHLFATLQPARAISGGAEGADTLYAHAALDAGIPLTLLLPNRHYRARYPRAVSDDIVERADEIIYAVDRPDDTDWRTRWDTDKWWRDNFARNRAMIAAADIAVVISDRRPRQLADERRGGTAACVRDLARTDLDIVWIPDHDTADMRWVTLTNPSPSTR